MTLLRSGQGSADPHLEEAYVSENQGYDETQESGRTPDAPDVDQPQGGNGGAGRTPDAPDVDKQQGGAHPQ